MTECSVCAFAAANGHWGQPGTHCKDCHRSWVSTAQAHCTLCHENFATDGVANLHWVRNEHTNPSRVRKLESHAEAFGTVWRTAQK